MDTSAGCYRLPERLRSCVLLEVVTVPAVLTLGTSANTSHYSDLRRTAFSVRWHALSIVCSEV